MKDSRASALPSARIRTGRVPCLPRYGLTARVVAESAQHSVHGSDGTHRRGLGSLRHGRIAECSGADRHHPLAGILGEQRDRADRCDQARARARGTRAREAVIQAKSRPGAADHDHEHRHSAGPASHGDRRWRDDRSPAADDDYRDRGTRRGYFPCRSRGSSALHAVRPALEQDGLISAANSAQQNAEQIPRILGEDIRHARGDRAERFTREQSPSPNATDSGVGDV